MDVLGDLSTMFALKADGGLADPAILQGAIVIPVMFDESFQSNFGVAGTNPTALAKASDVSVSNIGQALTINSTIYTIRGREKQDDGATVLLQLEGP